MSGDFYAPQSQYNPQYDQQYKHYPRQASTVATGNDMRREATMRNFITSNDNRTRPDADPDNPPIFDTPKKNPWTKGGGLACGARFFGCSIMLLVYLVLCGLLSFALWIRPPALTFGQMGLDTQAASPISLVGTAISVNLAIDIFVENPNTFSANFKQIRATVNYPLSTGESQIGLGTVNDFVFSANKNTTLHFPLAITYDPNADPGGLIRESLLSKCTSNQPISVDATLSLGLRILFVTITPVVKRSFSFACPSQLESLIKQLGTAVTGGT
ncbi:hypothetical protein C8J56DRAFT_965283 [Mycena floridula]|nr:hypothetical protein C8J56DRAFT_965283 [Mycena floridula]